MNRTFLRAGCLLFVAAMAFRCDTGSPVDRDPNGNPPSETPIASIRGTVTIDGTAIIGARVSLTGPAVERWTTTGANGSFTFEDLPRGTYSLTAVPPGFACDSAAAEVETGETVPVSIVCAQQHAIVMGTVTADGSPIDGATVRLSRIGVELTRTTGVDGAFSFDSVPAGFSYSLTATAPGADCGTRNVRAHLTNTADIFCRRFRGLRVNVIQNDWPDLQWHFVLFVTGPENRKTSGILRTLFSSEFSDLPPGDYAVAAGVASLGLYCQSAVATVQAIQGTSVDIPCTFQPGGTTNIRGQVTINGAGRGIVPVELRDPSRTALLGLTTTVSFDEDGSSGSGKYQFRNLVPGDYAVIARMPAGAPCDDIRQNAIVREGQETILDFACDSQTTGSIAGFVDSEDLSDMQLAGRSVTVTGTVSRETVTGPWNGVYAFDDLPPGEYVVTSSCSVSLSVTVQAGRTAPATMMC